MAYLNIKRQDLELVEQIGEGGYSSVYKAKWNGQDVAAKRLNSVDRHEVDMLAPLDHPHIVKLIGLVDEKCEMLLILELCKGGSLRSYLNTFRSNGERLSMDQFVDLAQQAAKPIQYLKKMKIVHKDVKSPNYLIADGNVLKLADFGLAKNLAHTTKHGTERASYAWMAPELLKEGILSPRFDIYAYGVVIWELWTTEFPFEDSNHCNNIIWRICNDNERPAIPSDCPKAISDLIRQCWLDDWHKRPTIEHILHVLSAQILPSGEQVGEPPQKPLPLTPGPWELVNEFSVTGLGTLSDASIAVNPSNTDVVIADAARVMVYTKEGIYKMTMDTRQGMAPGMTTLSQTRNVCVSSNGNYYVTDGRPYVLMHDARGMFKSRWTTVSPNGTPSDKTKEALLVGLAMDVKGQLLLVGDVNHKYISKHAMDGSHVTSIKVEVEPWFLAVTSQETIVICEAVQKVLIVDSTGLELHTIMPPSSAVCGFLPWSVCCSEDTIYVSNRIALSTSICCFSLSGEYKEAIAVRGPLRGIAFAGDNQILVNYRDKVAVYSQLLFADRVQCHFRPRSNSNP